MLLSLNKNTVRRCSPFLRLGEVVFFPLQNTTCQVTDLLHICFSCGNSCLHMQTKLMAPALQRNTRLFTAMLVGQRAEDGGSLNGDQKVLKEADRPYSHGKHFTDNMLRVGSSKA